MSPLAILGALLVAGASPAVPAPRGALLLLDVPAADAPRVKSALGDRVLDEATTKKIEADAAEVGLGCPELSDACAKGFAQLAGVDEVVVVTVRPHGGARLTRAARLDARTGRVVDVTVGLLTSRPGDGGVAVAVVAANLFAKEKTPAPVPVDVVVQPAGTPIHIDGRPAALRDGTAWLLPGPHELVLEGPAAATTKIVVTDRGEPGRVELAVVGPPSSPTVTTPVAGGDHAIWPAVVTWTGVGVGVVGGLVAGGSELFLDEQLSGDGLEANERALGERAGQAGLVAAVAGVVVTAVGAGLSWSMP